MEKIQLKKSVLYWIIFSDEYEICVNGKENKRNVIIGSSGNPYGTREVSRKSVKLHVVGPFHFIEMLHHFTLMN